MDNRQKSIILGGILVAGGLIGWYTFYRKRKETPLSYAPVPRDQVLTILANIAYQNECLIKELSNLQDLTSPSMIEKLNEFRKIACKKGEVEEKVLRVVSERDFSEDRQIQSLRNEAFTAYDKGIAILSAIKEKKGVEFLTPKLILDLLCKEYKDRSYKMHESLMELKKQGVEIDMREPTADRVAVAAVFNDPKFLEIRYTIRVSLSKSVRKSTISELGLDPSNKEYDNILEEISRLYMIQDKDDFMQKVMIMSAQSNTVLESLSFDSPDAISLIEEIGTYQ